MITKEADSHLQNVRSRMPLLLEPNEIDLWLNCQDYSFKDLKNTNIMNPGKQVYQHIGFNQVSNYLDNQNNKDSKCIMSINEYLKYIDQQGIKKYYSSKSEGKYTRKHHH